MRQVSKWVTIFKVINSPSGCQRDFEHWIDLLLLDVKWMQDKLTVVYILAAGDQNQPITKQYRVPFQTRDLRLSQLLTVDCRLSTAVATPTTITAATSTSTRATLVAEKSASIVYGP